MDSLELHGQGTQAAVTGQPEGRVFLEHLPVQVHTDVRPHVLGTNLEYLQGVTEREENKEGVNRT